MNKKEKLIKFQKNLLEKFFPFGDFPEETDKEKALETFSKNVLPLELKESTTQYLTFRKELTKESDRGAALLAASHLDFMLQSLLNKILLGTSKQKKSLFDFTGPLGAFSSRILMSYSLGLISKNAYHDLQIIRKVRNEFGHSPELISFEDDKIRNRCLSLKLSVWGNEASSRSIFLNVVSALSGQIEAETIIANSFKEKEDFNLIERRKKFDRLMELINQAAQNIE